MKILVTGGCGLIGHNVVAKLVNQGHEVVIVDNKTDYGLIPRDELEYVLTERMKKIPDSVRVRDIDIESRHVEIVFDEFKPEAVIHLASFPRQKVVNANPQLGARVMCEGLLNLLELSVKHTVNKFVYISSSMVYGDFQDDVREDAVCRPQGQYGIMKWMGEHLVRDYSRKTGINHVIIRPSAVYGELDVEDRVISKFMLAALRDETLKVNGATETLDFTYVDDAADGIIAATLSSNTDNKTYNITKSHSHSLLAAAKLAVKIAGRGSIEIRGRDLDFPSRGSLNIDAARQDFDYNPKTDVEEGFKRYHDWFLSSDYWKNKIINN
jgi:UDP-glucuronate 4-epimerase